MARRKSALAILVLLVLTAGACFAEITPWADTWSNAVYYKTNGERNNYNSFNLRSEGKFGIKLPVGSDITLNPYVAYYGVYAINDPNYWNNQLAYGVGARVYPFLSYQGTTWANEWIPDVKFFAETLKLAFLKDETTAVADGVKTSDTRYGADLWHEWNLKDINMALPWNELWANLSHRSTDFSKFSKFDTFILTLQNKFGVHMGGGVRPYLATYLTYTADRSEPWYNSFYYGVGGRVEPFREQKDSPELLRKFKMFVEVLGIAWLKDVDPTRPNNDFRFGIDFTYGR
jgi:hypothetical protein